MKTQTFRFTLFVALAVLLTLLAPMATPTAHAATCTVTTNADSGAGSLREKIADATCDTINFAGDYTITLASQLLIAHNLTIDGAGHSVTVSGNNAVRVFYVHSGTTFNLQNITVANGKDIPATVYGGGGMYNDGGTVTVTNSTFSGNSASLFGAGIVNIRTGTLTVISSTFVGNSAAGAGGILSAGTLNVTNSTFSANSGSDYAGAIYIQYGTATVTNSTFSGNSGNYNYSGGIHIGSGTLTVRNTIVANNTGGNCGGHIESISGSNNLANDGTCGASFANSSSILLGTLGNYGGSTQTIPILAGSSAIDAGTDTGCPATDQRGIARPQGAHCDIGAFELVDNTAPSITITAPTATNYQLNQVVAANYACADNESGVASCVGTVPNGANIDTATPGSKTFTVNATNLLGRTSSQSVTYTVGQSFPTTSILDNFNRANGRLGNNWDGADNMGFYRIVNNRVDVIAGGPTVWSPASFGVNQEAFVKLSAIAPRGREQGLLLKVQAGRLPQTAGMAVVYDAVAHAVRVETLRVHPFDWNRYPNQAATFANGDQLGAQVLASGTVKIYKNGTQIATVTLNAQDQTFFNGKGGKIGLWTVGAHNAAFDDFGGGNTN